MAVFTAPAVALLVLLRSAVEHHKLVAHDLGCVAVVAVAVLPLTGCQAPRDVDLAALAQILLRNINKASAQDDGDPFGALLALARLLVFPLLGDRSEEHTSELQSLMRISYAVF